MKSPSPDKIRNVALVAHGGAGKTTLAEAILFLGGSVARMGRVDDGSSALDYAENEKKREISINLGIAYGTWNGTKINVLDCPGYADFYGDVRAGLRVADSAIVVIAAPSAVEVGTELVWQFLDQMSLPRAICVNKMDKEHADFRKCLASLSEMFGARTAPVTVPIGAANGFKGIVDLIEEKAYVYDGPGKFKKEDVPAEMADEVAEFRTQLIEAAAESDETLMEKFFGDEPLSVDEIRRGLREGVAAATIVPVVATAAGSGVGVESLMDLLVGVMPSPADVPEVVGAKPRSEDEEKRPVTVDAPFAALVFKTVAEQHVGELSFFRVYSGRVSSGNDVLNATKDESERMGQIHAMVGRDRKEFGEVTAGDIAAVVKLRVSRSCARRTRRSRRTSTPSSGRRSSAASATCTSTSWSRSSRTSSGSRSTGRSRRFRTGRRSA